MQDSQLDSNGGFVGDTAGGDWWSQNQPPIPPGFPPGTTRDPVTGAYIYPPGYNGAGQTAGPTSNVGLPGIDGLPIQAPAPQTDPTTPNPVVNPTTMNPGTITGNTGVVPQGVPTSGFGAAPPPYHSDPNAPVYQPMPTYVPPTWTGGDYVNPTEADLQASPGYAARLAAGQQVRERSAAAQGTILNGGTVKALDREAQNFATNEYQTLRNNTYDAYVQKYKQFTDAAGMDLNARTVNANENLNTFANRTSTFNTGNARTLSDYTTNVINNRNSELDYWNRLNDVNSTGATLAGGSR
jgi:hypothetical protein